MSTPEPRMLLERDAAIEAVERTLAVARGGRGAVLVLAGEAGVGKSSLLRRVRAAPGFTVGLGRGDAMEAALPYGLLHQALAALGDGLPLGEEVAAGGAADARGAQFYATLRWFEQVADGPILLALDDLHWADPDSLALLSVLCRRIEDRPVAMVATVRPWPPAALEMAEGLEAAGLAAIQRLRPLSRDAAGSLLSARVSEAVDPAEQARAWELTAGNPLLLEQAAAALSRGEHLAADAQGARPGLLLSRFAGVPAEALTLARAAAILGVRFRPAVAAELAGLDAAAADAAFDALGRAGLLRADGNAASFVHPLFQQGLYDAAEPAVRLRLHGRAFQLLAGRGITAEAAEQALRADLDGDPDAAAVLRRAGHAALVSGAVSSALRLLRGAVAVAGDAAAPELALELATAALAAGEVEEALTVSRGLLGRPDLPAGDRAAALAVVGRAQFHAGGHPQSDAAFQQAAAAALADDVTVAVEVTLEHAATTLFSVGPAPALEIARSGRELAATAPPAVQGAADIAVAISAVLRGDLEPLAAAERAAAAVLRLEAVDRAATLTLYGNALRLVERFDTATTAFSQALRWSEQVGDPVTIALAAGSLADVLARSGRVEEALAQVEVAVAAGELTPVTGPLAASLHAEILFQLGRPQECDLRREPAEEQAARRQEWLPLLWLQLTGARRDLQVGDLAAARERILAAEELCRSRQLVEPCLVPWARDAVLVHLAADKAEDAERVLAWLDSCASRLPCVYPRAVSLAGRAALAERRGDAGEADRLFVEAEALLAGSPLVLERLRTLVERGAALRRAGRAVDARPVLGEALAGAEGAGAVWLAGLAREELAVAGGRRRRRRDDGGLTAAEDRVAALAAQGLTNAEIASRLFVSAKTVDTHLQHIYGKLGIRSRRELMLMATEAAAD